jgi:hypothetical protein
LQDRIQGIDRTGIYTDMAGHAQRQIKQGPDPFFSRDLCHNCAKRVCHGFGRTDQTAGTAVDTGGIDNTMPVFFFADNRMGGAYDPAGGASGAVCGNEKRHYISPGL